MVYLYFFENPFKFKLKQISWNWETSFQNAQNEERVFLIQRDAEPQLSRKFILNIKFNSISLWD